MTKLTLAQMVAGLQDLDREELTFLNKRLIELAKSKDQAKRFDKAAEVVGKFQVGDIITFVKSGRGKGGGVRHYFRYDKLNRNGDCMQGPSCGPDGKVGPLSSKWTVGLTQPTCEVHMRNGKMVG